MIHAANAAYEMKCSDKLLMETLKIVVAAFLLDFPPCVNLVDRFFVIEIAREVFRVVSH